MGAYAKITLSQIFHGFVEGISMKYYIFQKKVGGVDRSLGSMSQFRMALADCGLIDIRFSGPRLTWNNKRELETQVR